MYFMLKMENGYKIEEKLIIDFEKKFEINLPKDYKEFMIENNGGESDNDLFFDFYDNVTQKNNSSVIRSFFRIYEIKNNKIVYDDLEKICKIMWEEGTLDKKMLPIADDPGGNVICISLFSEDYGTVYFANHEYEDSDTGYLFVSKIANSFSEFVAILYLDEE